MAKFESKLPDVKTSIFTEMSALAAKTGSINLSQGFPEFETPPYLKTAVTDAINHDFNQYSPSNGQSQLLDQIGMMIKNRYQCSLLPQDNITITSGATEALFVAIQTLISKDDEVIIFDPAYDSYEPAVKLAGGRCVHIPLKAPEYKIDWLQVTEAINSKTKAIIINTPHNPTGSLLQANDLESLEKIIDVHQLFLISDEVYEFITFDNKRHESILRYPKLFERSFVISSFGKTFHCTGWKMGYCVAPKTLTDEFRKIHQYVTFCSPTPFQIGVEKMLAKLPQHIDELPNFYQAKRDILVQALIGSKLKVLPCNGTYFILVDYSEISNLEAAGLNDKAFCYWLAEEKKIAAVPLSPFYEKGSDAKVIRLCFAKNDDTLKRAGEVLCQL